MQFRFAFDIVVRGLLQNLWIERSDWYTPWGYFPLKLIGILRLMAKHLNYLNLFNVLYPPLENIIILYLSKISEKNLYSIYILHALIAWALHFLLGFSTTQIKRHPLLNRCFTNLNPNPYYTNLKLYTCKWIITQPWLKML